MKQCPALVVSFLLCACGGGSGQGAGDGGPARADAATEPGATADAGGSGRADASDSGGGGGGSEADGGGAGSGADGGGGGGGGEADGSVPAQADAGSGGGAPPGLSEPCEAGPGWSLFRFHYDPNYGQNPDVEVWDATCSYSYAPQSACRIDAIGSVGTAAGGYAIALGGSDYLRVRFSVSGLSFTQAAVYIKGRSLSTTASTQFEVWSPLYGSAYGGPVDNDFVYDWYGVDWSSYLDPSDDPALTAIQIYPYLGSGSLGIAAVELCVQ